MQIVSENPEEILSPGNEGLLSHFAKRFKAITGKQVHFGAQSHIPYRQLSSNPDLGYEAQLRAVSSAHIVITTHGAFQANMLFMQNRALLVELFGNIHHPPTHVFRKFALSFELFYGRVHASSFKSNPCISPTLT